MSWARETGISFQGFPKDGKMSKVSKHVYFFTLFNSLMTSEVLNFIVGRFICNKYLKVGRGGGEA